jgi:UDP-N-acetylmuramoyl-L-alanyl-D-glutamate--2,6-diaminopimelate ligase
LKKSQSKFVIVTSPHKINEENVYTISNDQFQSLQDALVNHFYPIKSDTKICGITGTNGKTTVVHLCNSLAQISGNKAISIGTLGVVNQNGDLLEEINSTTPSYIDLRRIITQYQNEYETFFIEVSSHGLEQGRMRGLQFCVSAWTSFSQDHLDYHHSMNEYFNAKLKILNHLKKDANLYVPVTEKELQQELPRIDNIVVAHELNYWSPKNVLPVFNIAYNKSNLEIALEIVNTLWTIKKNIDLKLLTTPPGRFSLLENNNQLVVIDYAHTPAALENICNAVRVEYKDLFLIVVFGCGGDRDPSKRPLMGAAAEKYADLTIVTSDNPRSENPSEIIAEIVKGMKKNKLIEKDRARAIELAMTYDINKPTIIIIAGKGHESYQEIKGVKTEFSDFKIVKKIWDR